MKKPQETLAFFLLLTLGLVPRLAMAASFPIIPVLDFRNLVSFGLNLRDSGLINHATPWHWKSFNVGMPLVLCGLFHLFPKGNPDQVARLATAVVNGLLALLPFFIWRGVFSLRLRVLTGCALAIWPGQVFNSGVVAQDNWTIFPAIALGALAVRALADAKRAWPLTAGLLYAAAIAVRQDMLVVLPLLLAAVRADLFRTMRRQVLAGTLAAAFGLFGLAAYRYEVTGRFSLSTQHGGVTVLGAYITGSSLHGWVGPYAYLASIRPDLLHDPDAMLSQGMGIAVREALRRPGFHVLRIVSMAGFYAIHGESDLLQGSLTDPEALPAALHERGVTLADRVDLPLCIEMTVIQVLFFAAVIVGCKRRNMAILVLSSTVLLKYAFHAFVVLNGRFFLPATGLEILTIAVALGEVFRPDVPGWRRLLAQGFAGGSAFGLILLFLMPPLLAHVQSRDIDPQQHTYRYFLRPLDNYGELACTTDQGLLASYTIGIEAMLRTLEPHDPAPGDRAVAECVLNGSGAPKPLVLQVFRPFAPGGMGGRMVQRVEVDGEEVYSRDLGQEPGSGWTDIPLGNVGEGTRKRVVIEVKAIHPEAGANWAWNSRTSFRLARSSSTPHLAMGRPTSQSSNLGSGGSSGAAADGTTDGNFYRGSVSSTNRDTNAWWQVDLGSSKATGSIVIWNRTDCCASRLSDYWVFVSDTPFGSTDTPSTLQKRAGTWKSHQTSAPDPSTTIATGGAKGRYIRVQLNGTDYLSLAEVQVFGQ